MTSIIWDGSIFDKSATGIFATHGLMTASMEYVEVCLYDLKRITFSILASSILWYSPQVPVYLFDVGGAKPQTFNSPLDKKTYNLKPIVYVSRLQLVRRHRFGRIVE